MCIKGFNSYVWKKFKLWLITFFSVNWIYRVQARCFLLPPHPLPPPPPSTPSSSPPPTLSARPTNTWARPPPRPASPYPWLKWTAAARTAGRRTQSIRIPSGSAWNLVSGSPSSLNQSEYYFLPLPEKLRQPPKRDSSFLLTMNYYNSDIGYDNNNAIGKATTQL